MRTVLVVLALGAASLLHAQERTLAWKSLDVTAKLADDGTLAISERHRMRFDGNWNGGERIFRLQPGQQLRLFGMSRVDQNGETHPMTEATGSGIGLHQYRFDGETLRWRAREASDPPFRNAERVYVIHYAMRNVVQRNGEDYVLDHDFAFADRPAPIESFSAKLELDSGWQAPADFVPAFERTDLPPGESAILKLQLKWVGEGTPEHVAPLVPPEMTPAPGVVTTPRRVPPPALPPPPPPVSTWVKLAALGAFAIAAMLLMNRFLVREEAVGRHEPPPDVTPAWLEAHLLVHRAEVVGAAWDGATGPGEVAALIAIMTAEGKIENVPGAPKLRLLVPRESLSDYERGFVDALFIRGDEIDPETLRLHYRETGFRPEQTIASTLMAAARKLVGDAPAPSWALGLLAFVVTLLFLPIVAVAFLVTLALVSAYRNAFPGRQAARILPLPLLGAAVLHTYVNDSLGWLIASLVAGALLLWLALRFASWRESEFELRNFRNFRAAREFLRQRIVQGDPEVDSRWIPYMLAFGLVPDDRWAVAAPASRRAADLVHHDHRHVAGGVGVGGAAGAGSGAGGERKTFEAGGGSFGGAGATGSWSSIQTFAATVAPRPAPSPRSSGSGSSGSGWSWSSSGSSSSGSSWGGSSSSSRGSSSSGSRSGGGGGGGW